MSRDYVRDYPYVIIAWLDIRFKAYLKTMANEYFGVTDYWFRYEEQARSSGYIHYIVWIDNTPQIGPKSPEE